MREILFRGKRVDNGEWVYGSPMFQDEYAFIRFWSSEEFMCVECTVIPETVGQYTGLTDKNGERIFEGDIVSHFVNGKEFKGVVRYADGAFGIRCENGAGQFLCFCNNGEVIGNIHDNHELIGGGEDA